jgi:hypothetical protein
MALMPVSMDSADMGSCGSSGLLGALVEVGRAFGRCGRQRRIASPHHAGACEAGFEKQSIGEIKPGLMPGLSAPPANSLFLPTRLQLGQFDG